MVFKRFLHTPQLLLKQSLLVPVKEDFRKSTFVAEELGKQNYSCKISQ